MLLLVWRRSYLACQECCCNHILLLPPSPRSTRKRGSCSWCGLICSPSFFVFVTSSSSSSRSHHSLEPRLKETSTDLKGNSIRSSAFNAVFVLSFFLRGGSRERETWFKWFNERPRSKFLVINFEFASNAILKGKYFPHSDHNVEQKTFLSHYLHGD